MNNPSPEKNHAKQSHLYTIKKIMVLKCKVNKQTCSGFNPGGTHAYSSRAQPESSSDVELRWKSYMSLFTVFSISKGITATTCSSRGHLQWRQIFLQRARKPFVSWMFLEKLFRWFCPISGAGTQNYKHILWQCDFGSSPMHPRQLSNPACVSFVEYNPFVLWQPVRVRRQTWLLKLLKPSPFLLHTNKAVPTQLISSVTTQKSQ